MLEAVKVLMAYLIKASHRKLKYIQANSLIFSWGLIGFLAIFIVIPKLTFFGKVFSKLNNIIVSRYTKVLSRKHVHTQTWKVVRNSDSLDHIWKHTQDYLFCTISFGTSGVLKLCWSITSEENIQSGGFSW